jgi:lipopolysaccharide transport system permease protein
MLVLAAIVVAFGIPLAPTLLLVPLAAALVVASAVGFGLWLSALTVRYRDLRLAMTFLLQLWMYATPVIYPAHLVTTKLERLGIPGWLYGLNPAAGYVTAARTLILGDAQFPWQMFGLSVLVSCVVFVTGLGVFLRSERTMADVI